jgi:plastocyanin
LICDAPPAVPDDVHRKICAAATLLTLTACAPATATTAPPAPAKRATTSGAADCTKATKVAITGADAFSPARLTIRRGDVLAVTNKSGKVHVLATTPDAGIVTSVLDRKERQFIQFPKAGAFTVESAGATLRVTVTGESGCGTPKPTLTLTAGDGVSPARLAVVATENFTVVNESGATRTVRCSPDPGSNKDNARLDKGETQLLAIDQPGRYTCGKATITVTAR